MHCKCVYLPNPENPMTAAISASPLIVPGVPNGKQIIFMYENIAGC